MPAKLRYSRDELMASHAYARPHEEAGYKLHGGFVDSGDYVSPRVLVRWPAVRAWVAALEARGGTLIDASRKLLSTPSYPTFDQHKFLLQHGLGQTLWNSLTTTGIIEKRGQAIASLSAPDIQAMVVEDIADTATAHLNAGLFTAHGWDEGGDPGHPELGAHDAMWFAARDLAFGKDAYPMPALPESIGRPVEDREMPMLSPETERVFKFLMDVLMIEVKAEVFFDLCCRVFADPDVFKDRRAQADQAAVLIDRIRTDEAVHVGYLQVVISELRTLTFKTVDGKLTPGADIIDPVWARMVEWHGLTSRNLGRDRSREEIVARIMAAKPGEAGRKLVAEFDALDAVVPQAA